MTTPLEGPEPHGDRAEVVQAQVQALWLQDMWSFYFHDPEDPSWTLESYRRLGDVASVEELWEMVEATGKHAHAGMFFAMREHVFPCWDDANNIDGGCVSIKVPADAARATWETLVKRALGETLVVERPMWASLNGISVSPKHGFCILKIWMADMACTGSIREYFRLPPEYRGEVVFPPEPREHADGRQEGRHSAEPKSVAGICIRHAFGTWSRSAAAVFGEVRSPDVLILRRDRKSNV